MQATLAGCGLAAAFGVEAGTGVAAGPRDVGACPLAESDDQRRFTGADRLLLLLAALLPSLFAETPVLPVSVCSCSITLGLVGALLAHLVQPPSRGWLV
uniref:Putative secreted protein n=1 Tax=Ixodes ricinus TaxID=34613 RepID=A0A6B0UFL0_IXORI